MKDIPSIKVPELKERPALRTEAFNKAALSWDDLSKFRRGNVVRHRKGGLYLILTVPAKNFLEATGTQAYSYLDASGDIWHRCEKEFDDGRFTLVAENIYLASTQASLNGEELLQISMIRSHGNGPLYNFPALGNPVDESALQEYEDLNIMDLFGFTFEAWQSLSTLVYTRCQKLAKDLKVKPT